MSMPGSRDFFSHFYRANNKSNGFSVQIMPDSDRRKFVVELDFLCVSVLWNLQN